MNNKVRIYTCAEKPPREFTPTAKKTTGRKNTSAVLQATRKNLCADLQATRFYTYRGKTPARFGI